MKQHSKHKKAEKQKAENFIDTLYTSINNVPTVFCDRCEQPVPSTQQPEAELPDKGLGIQIGGYYGGFEDNMFEPDPSFILCHDCCVWLYNEIPTLKERTFSSHKPCGNPACKWHYDMVN